MTSVTEQIRSLLAPPNAATSSGRTLSQIEQDYPSFESLSDLDALTHTLEKNKGLLTTREQDVSAFLFPFPTHYKWLTVTSLISLKHR